MTTIIKQRRRLIEKELQYDIFDSKKNGYLYTLISYLTKKIEKKYGIISYKRTFSVIVFSGKLSKTEEREIERMFYDLLEGRGRYFFNSLRR